MPASIRAQYALATADLDAAVADYNGAVVNAVRQTADAMTQVASLADQRASSNSGAEQRDPRLRSCQGTLSLGLSGQIPMLTAEATLLSARQQMAGAGRPRPPIQRVTLLLSVGGGFEPLPTDTKIATP